MKNSFFLILLILIVFGISCSEKQETPVATSIETPVLISIVNQQNLDLLDPNNPNDIQSENIKIFHTIDGKLTEFSGGLLDYPKGFRIYNPNDLGFNDQYLFCLLATDPAHNTGELESLLPITYIQWNETDMDTIQCQYSQTKSTLVTVKVWFNGNEVWDAEDMENNDSRWFQIVKN